MREPSVTVDNEIDEHSCLNCGEKLTGPYCAACGQKDIGNRLNSRLMLHNLFESLTDLNSKPWRTLIELVKNPGRVAYTYTQGARSSYINPIRFMITTYAIFIGFLAANGWLEADLTTGGTVRVTVDDEDIANGSEAMLAFQNIMTEIRVVLAQQRDLLTFLVIPLYALLLRWVFFKTRYNFAETLTLTCYMLGQIQIYAFIAALVPFFVPSVTFEGTPDFIYLVVFWLSIAGFYKRKKGKTFLMALAAYLLYPLANGGVALVLAMISMHFS